MLPRKELNNLQPFIDLCTVAYSEHSLTSLKQKFLNVEVTSEEFDPVLKSVMEKDIHQILSAQTLERARHYVRLLMKNLADGGSESASGLNINRWKGYDHIYTDSLWQLGKRVSDENHKAWYWGNFVPQIPFQLISRYTSPGDWILDPFCGSGTTLVEATKLGRNSIGIELNPDIYHKTSRYLVSTGTSDNVLAHMKLGDSIKTDFMALPEEYGFDGFKLAILHPPYWNIIKFSELQDDLSNSRDVGEFTSRLKLIASRAMPAMLPDSYMALVIGDTYRGGEIIPLGFRSMSALQELDLQLKGIIVKDIQNTKAKRTSENLWRYRALKSGFYVFKHEYIFVFKVRK